MYMDRGRSGTHNEHIGNHPDDWSGLSQNGRQYRSDVTGQINDLSGANYWHMRKELPDKLSVAESVRWDSYPTPKYYHVTKRKNEAPDVIDNEVVCDENVDIREIKGVMESLSDDNVFKILYLKVFGGKNG